ncbi:MAG: hypothetical protein DWG83_02735 [Chloroflexi bacterium]|nr:hypothetical protein [Chloroflexota bacterium]MQC19475.1 hypothetical protein [Chloroflexota bacterium]
MKIIGKQLGTVLVDMYEDIEKRLKDEAGRELKVVSFEGASFSDIQWGDTEVVISLHNGAPTRALNHILGIALQHIRQRLDRYPAVVRGRTEVEGGPLVRAALRELIMSPEAEQHVAPLKIDITWELKQRHEGLKHLLRDAPEDWNEESSIGHVFGALQYARFTIEHPEELWEGLRNQFRKDLPNVAMTGDEIVSLVAQHGWKTPGACLESFVAIRDALGLQDFVGIEDRRSGKIV